MTLKKKPFENIVGKGENAGNLDQSKNLPFGKELSVIFESKQIFIFQYEFQEVKWSGIHYFEINYI